MRITGIGLLQAIQERQKQLAESESDRTKCVALLIIDEYDKPNDIASNFVPPGSDRRSAQQHLVYFARMQNIPILAVTMRDSLNRKVHQWPLKLKALFPPDVKLFTKSEENAFHETSLRNTIRSLNVDTLVVAGFHVNACVGATIGARYDGHESPWEKSVPRPALSQGYRVMTAEDIVHSGWDDPDKKAFWSEDPRLAFYSYTV